MMSNCVAQHCRMVIDPNWAFCPYCGKDNRAPGTRTTVGFHKHEYLHDTGHCLKCGKHKGRLRRRQYDDDDGCAARGCGCLGWILDFLWWW